MVLIVEGRPLQKYLPGRMDWTTKTVILRKAPPWAGPGGFERLTEAQKKAILSFANYMVEHWRGKTGHSVVFERIKDLKAKKGLYHFGGKSKKERLELKHKRADEFLRGHAEYITPVA